MIYATRAAPQQADQPEIDTIVTRIRAKDYGLRSLMHEIVQSRVFLHKGVLTITGQLVEKGQTIFPWCRWLACTSHV